MNYDSGKVSDGTIRGMQTEIDRLKYAHNTIVGLNDIAAAEKTAMQAEIDRLKAEIKELRKND